MKSVIFFAALLGFKLTGLSQEDLPAPPVAALPPGSVPPTENFVNDHRFGAGLILGEPTGASLKWFLSDRFALDGACGWSFQHATDFYAHVDALWHAPDLWQVPEGRLMPYIGVGGRFKVREAGADKFGVRVPLGISYQFDGVPVDVFVEAAPIFDLTPETDVSFSAGIGARYWF